MGYFLYRLALRFYAFGIGLAAVFNEKATYFIEGRKHWKQELQDFRKNNSDKDIFWFHCASLGEFEQAKALIELLKSKKPGACIYLTFFSPSGFELKKNYSLARAVAYLPLDIGENASTFIEILRPKVAFFVKYEFWFGYFKALHKNQIPVIHFATVFRKNHFVFKSIANDLKRILKDFEWIFVQDENSMKIAQAQGMLNVSVAGDTRIDAIVSDKRKLNGVSNPFEGPIQRIIIGGSTYEDEEAILCRFLAKNRDWRAVIAPHNVSKERILSLKKRLTESKIGFKFWKEIDETTDVQVIVIDFVGILKEVYVLGTAALIGGGFQKSIHSILEPAAHFLPMSFGTKHQKFHEAQTFIEMNCAFEIQDYSDFEKFMGNLENEVFVNECRNKLENFMNENQGAPQKIFSYLEEKGLV